jgi:hypothetical protein
VGFFSFEKVDIEHIVHLINSAAYHISELPPELLCIEVRQLCINLDHFYVCVQFILTGRYQNRISLFQSQRGLLFYFEYSPIIRVIHANLTYNDWTMICFQRKQTLLIRVWSTDVVLFVILSFISFI